MLWSLGLSPSPSIHVPATWAPPSHQKFPHSGLSIGIWGCHWCIFPKEGKPLWIYLLPRLGFLGGSLQFPSFTDVSTKLLSVMHSPLWWSCCEEHDTNLCCILLYSKSPTSGHPSRIVAIPKSMDITATKTRVICFHCRRYNPSNAVLPL